MSYSFGEIRKTAAAAGGLALTGIAYVLADDNLREFIPPQWIAVAGALATIFGVFRASDDRVPDPKKPGQAIQIALDSITKAQAKIESDKAAVAAQDQALNAALSTMTPSGTTPISLPASPTSAVPGFPPIAPAVLSSLDHALIDAYRDDTSPTAVPANA